MATTSRRGQVKNVMTALPGSEVVSQAKVGSFADADGPDSSTARVRNPPATGAALRQAILVLGMHRSGTSAVTRIINLLGADLASNLMPPVKNNNEAGFWESMDAYRLNDDILASAGSRWDDWLSFNPQWVRSQAKPAFKAHALRFLQRDFGKSSLFVLKDPRICRLLPFWLEVLRDFGAEPKCVLTIRNPLEVAASLKRRDGFAHPKSNILWLRHVLDAERETRGVTRAFVVYEEMLADWRGVVEELSSRIEVLWPRRSATCEVEIDRFLKDDLRHHASSNASLLQRPHLFSEHPDLPSWVKETYSALIELHSCPDAQEPQTRLDMVSADLNRTGEVLGALFRSEEMAREEAEAAATERIDELEDNIAEREAHIAEREAHVEQVEQVAGKREDRIAELERAIDQRAVRIGELEQVIKERDVCIGELERAIDGRAVRIGELEQVIGKRDVRIRGLQQLAGSHEARIKGLQSELATTSSRIEVRNQVVHRLDAIQTSVAWQLARPARTLESRWPRLIRGIAAMPKLAWWSLTFRLPQRLRVRRLATELLALGLFDRPWYAENNLDILLDGQSLALHWLVRGWTEGRDPNPLFDTDWYLAQNPDVAAAGNNPLAHYLAKGAAEGRDPSPLFDTAWYLSQDRDVARSGVNPLAHYLRRGAHERLSPNAFFDPAWYLEQYPAVASANLNPLIHYLCWGADRGFDPGPLFDGAFYLRQNPEVAATGENPLLHYLRVGIRSGRPCRSPDRAKPKRAASAQGPDEYARSELRLPAGFTRQLAPKPDPDPNRILVIDWKPPTPDRDSGSYRMSKILQCFVDAGFEVDFVGDQDAEEPAYAQTLTRQGIATIIGRDAAIHHLFKHGFEYRLAVIARPELFDRYASLVRAFAIHAALVYDTVDLHWVRLSRGAQIAPQVVDLEATASSYKRLELVNARCADVTIAITEDEKKLLLEEEPDLDIRVVPNIHEAQQRVWPFSERRDLFFIGGFDHKPNVEAIHYFVAEILPLVTSRLPDIRLRIVGSNMPVEVQALASEHVEPIGYAKDVAPYFQQSRVFVAPLLHGAGMKGKVNQSLSFGLPVVTTQIGAEGIGLMNGENALICDQPADFAAGILRLYGDEQLWSRLSEAGRELIRTCFSLSAVRGRILSLVEAEAR
jgi:glycosyltransferase involved in cell wall biosynthesis